MYNNVTGNEASFTKAVEEALLFQGVSDDNGMYKYSLSLLRSRLWGENR
jgi:hypothetical protein